MKGRGSGGVKREEERREGKELEGEGRKLEGRKEKPEGRNRKIMVGK